MTIPTRRYLIGRNVWREVVLGREDKAPSASPPSPSSSLLLAALARRRRRLRARIPLAGHELRGAARPARPRAARRRVRRHLLVRRALDPRRPLLARRRAGEQLAREAEASTRPIPSAYDWSRYDPVLDEAKARGWSVLLTLSGPVPRWATNGARNTVTRPRPKEFALFVTAGGAPLRRPRVDVVDLERAQPSAVPAPAVHGAPPRRRRRGSTAASTSPRCAASRRRASSRACSSARRRRAAPAASSRR